jgi:conjugal transfer pilus assembly protein TrbC
MRKTLVAIGACVALASVSAVVAQTLGGLDLQRIQDKADKEGGDLSALVGQAASRGELYKDSAEKTAGDAITAIKSIDPARLPVSTKGAVDFDAMVAGAQANLNAPKSAPLLIGFASMSMPPEALKRMIEDVQRAGGVIVFRGFPGNSGKAFGASILKVVSREDASNISIDPRLFRAFKVQVAPTYVVTSTDFTPCDGFDCKSEVPAFDQMSGNTTLRYVLTTISEANGPGAAVARVALANLEKPL